MVCKQLALMLAFATSAAMAQTAVDGDTLKLDGAIWRLWGIDAPEMSQTCADGWRAGEAAKAALATLMVGRSVSCISRTRDRYGRLVGICRADGVDLGAEMVNNGMAFAFVQYSTDYVPNEQAAIRGSAGLHLHDCLKPWVWRAERRATAR